MMERIKAWLKAPGVFQSRQAFREAMEASAMQRAEVESGERVDSEPPPPASRDSGPDVLDGLSVGAHP